MNLPIQALPIIRNISTAKLSQIKGIEISLLRNPRLQCDLCCQIGGGIACGQIPGCSCEM